MPLCCCAHLLMLCSCFLRGKPVGRAMALLVSSRVLWAVHYRRAFVSRYPPVEQG
jgi:hypothetical protein